MLCQFTSPAAVSRGVAAAGFQELPPAPGAAGWGCFQERSLWAAPLQPTSTSQQEPRVYLSGQGQGMLLETGVLTPETVIGDSQ